MTSPKQDISQSKMHSIVHILLRAFMAILSLVCLQFAYVAFSEGQYEALGILPFVAGIFFLISKTALRTRRVRGDNSGFDVLIGGEWQSHSWQEVSHVGRALWAFNPSFPVVEIQLGDKEETIFLFGGTKEQELIESLRS